MRIFGLFSFALVAPALMSAGCAHPPRPTQTSVSDTKPEGARLSSAEAIQIARQAVERHGVSLRGYKEPKVHYDSMSISYDSIHISAETLLILKQAAEDHSLRLLDYEGPTLRYESTRIKRTWFMFFAHKVPTSGKSFSVLINDDTGDIRFF